MASYNLKRMGIAALIGSVGFGISYLGIPPIKETKKIMVPIELRLLNKNGYAPTDFGYIGISSEGKTWCGIMATTAVRNYFDTKDEYLERSNVMREVCQIPSDSTNLKAMVSLPYRPEASSIESSLGSCTPFVTDNNRWFSQCEFNLPQAKTNMRYLAYEDKIMTLDQNLQMQAGKHLRNADLFNFTLVKF